MADGEAMTRGDAVPDALRAEWQNTEDAIAAAGAHFEEAGYEGWTWETSSATSPASPTTRPAQHAGDDRHGEHVLSTPEENMAGVERFRTLDYKMLRIELNTAHGVVWMYIQRFSDEDLAQRYKMGTATSGWASSSRLLGQHETWHVADALKAAGVPESAVAPLDDGAPLGLGRAAPDGGWMMADGRGDDPRARSSSRSASAGSRPRTRSRRWGSTSRRRPTTAGRSGTVFRHLTAASHIMSSRIRALLSDGRASLPRGRRQRGRCREVRVARLQDAADRAEHAHGVVWMYIQRFSDEDLAQTFTIFGEEETLGEIIRDRVLHEAWHVKEALEATGLPQSRRSCRWRRPIAGPERGCIWTGPARWATMRVALSGGR